LFNAASNISLPKTKPKDFYPTKQEVDIFDLFLNIKKTKEFENKWNIAKG